VLSDDFGDTFNGFTRGKQLSWGSTKSGVGSVTNFSAFIRRFKEYLTSIREKRRIKILCSYGMHIGKNVTIMPGVDFDFPYSHLIYIGNNCSISRDVRIMVHDATVNKYLGYTVVEPVVINDNCFIGERAIILPGVEIGPDAIVAAGSLVNKRIPPGRVAAGVPARIYSTIDDFLSQVSDSIKNGIIYEFNEFFNIANLEHIRENLMRHKRISIRNIKRQSLIYGGSPSIINTSRYRNFRNNLEQELKRIQSANQS